MTKSRPITFAQVKLEIRADPDTSRKYARFLDKLALEHDNRGKIDSWDIWYFSLNTDFCLDSAKHYFDELDHLFAAYKSLRETKEALGKYHPDKLRRTFGSLFFYLYAALESFSHEANILYGLRLPREDVSLMRVKRALEGRQCQLKSHMQQFRSKSSVQTFLEYRNAIMHGYVYPISGAKEGLLLKRNPKIPFSFSNVNVDFKAFVASSFSEVNEFIRGGWRCFSFDELSQPR